MSSIMKLLLVTQMKSSKMPCVEWIPFVVVILMTKERMMTQQIPLVAVST